MAKRIGPPSHRRPGARAGKPGTGRSGTGRPGGRASSAPVGGQPVFAQPTHSPDPTGFKDPVTDRNEPDVAGVQPVPQPSTSGAEPILTLATIYGSQGASHYADDSTVRPDRLSRGGRHGKCGRTGHAVSGCR